MVDANYARFNERLREIERRHGRRRSGYVRLEERDGILVPVGGRVPRRRGLPLRGLTLALVAFVLFKGFLLAYLGPGTYADRVGRLAEGNVVEQMGAWVMGGDPVTLWVAQQFRQVF